MISVEEARRRITGTLGPVAAERVSLTDALGRVLAEDIRSRVTQPPAAVSAMDGYAVRAADVAKVPATLEVVGSAPAGGAFDGMVEAGQAVRIFTGAPVPGGADAIVIQEDTEATDRRVIVKESAKKGHYIRPEGLDFREGDIGLPAGRVLSPRDIGLAAAMNVPWLSVRRKPRVAILATGDELVMPGEPIGPHQIVSSNGWALAAFIEANGAVPVNLGIAPDDREALKSMAAGAAGADLLVTSGGASVGDHDLVASALQESGLHIDFWRIAMRPGKPLMFGRIGDTPLLGLPGNPVSSLVCALIFLAPIIDTMLGIDRGDEPPVTARLGAAVGINDRRQDYLRATLSRGEAGDLIATPFAKQDSSMLLRLVQADCLIVREPHAPAGRKGARVPILPFPQRGPSV